MSGGNRGQDEHEHEHDAKAAERELVALRGSDDDGELVVVAQFDDPMAAQMTLDFLRSDGLTVHTLGNAPGVTILNRFATIVDIRLAVPASQTERARETLAALRGDGTPEAHPYRGDAEPPAEVAQGEAIQRKKYKRVAFVAGLALPIGAGHFYAEHGPMAVILLAGIGTGVGMGIRGAPFGLYAALLIVLADMILAPFAVTRLNEQRVPSPSKQRLLALGIVAAAFAIAVLTGDA
jgi:hypothetical protein